MMPEFLRRRETKKYSHGRRDSPFQGGDHRCESRRVCSACLLESAMSEIAWPGTAVTPVRQRCSAPQLHCTMAQAFLPTPGAVARVPDVRIYPIGWVTVIAMEAVLVCPLVGSTAWKVIVQAATGNDMEMSDG